jgi:hypothetical protein
MSALRSIRDSSAADFAEAIRGGAIVLFPPPRAHELGEIPGWLIGKPVIDTDSRLVRAVSAALGRAVVGVAFREDGGMALSVEGELPDPFEIYAELQRLAGGRARSDLWWAKNRPLWFEVLTMGCVWGHGRTEAEAERIAANLRRAHAPDVTIRPCSELDVSRFRSGGTQ